jgi:hypothetical protein
MAEIESIGGDKVLYAYGKYIENVQTWNFMDLSFKGGSDYKNGKDSEGNPIFQQHKKEDNEEAKVRRGRASVMNYCRFFSDRFSGYLKKKQAYRASFASEVSWVEFTKDATGENKSFAEYVSDWQQRALRLSPYWARIGTSFAPPLSNRPDGPLLSDPKIVRPRAYVSFVDPRNVVDYEYSLNTDELVRIVVREEIRIKRTSLDPENVAVIFHEWTKDARVTYRQVPGQITPNESVVQHLDLTRPRGPSFTVKEIDRTANPFGFVPYVPLHFGEEEDDNRMFSPSMIHDVAHIQRDIFRVGSLLSEELMNRTFTTQVIMGANADEVQSQINRMLLVIRNPAASVAKAGSDTRQTEALLDSLHFLIRNIFRVAQFESSGDPKESRTAESGEKRARDLEGLYQVLAGFAKGTEAAENKLIDMWGLISNKEPDLFSVTSHPTDFDVQSVDEDLDQLAQMELVSFPKTFTDEIRRGIMRKMRPNADQTFWSLVESELMQELPEGSFAPPSQSQVN